MSSSNAKKTDCSSENTVNNIRQSNCTIHYVDNFGAKHMGSELNNYNATA